MARNGAMELCDVVPEGLFVFFEHHFEFILSLLRKSHNPRRVWADFCQRFETEVSMVDVHSSVYYLVDPYPSMGVNVAEFERRPKGGGYIIYKPEQ